jgi:cell division protein ZapA
MSHINVTINGRQYRMACEEGQEVRLLKLAESLETRIQSLRGKFGEIGDARLTVMAALTVCDELVDAGNRVRAMEQELTELRDFRNAAVERARMTQNAVVNALNAAAERIEKSTQVLNRTVGNGIAIGWISWTLMVRSPPQAGVSNHAGRALSPYPGGHVGSLW